MQKTILITARKSLAMLAMSALVLSTFGAAFMTSLPVAQAATAPNWNATGTYQLLLAGTYAHDIVITTQNPDGTFSGTGGYPAGDSPYTAPGQTAETITGQVTGNAITLTITYTGPFNPGYSATLTGTIASDGTMSGTSPSEWHTTSGNAVTLGTLSAQDFGVMNFSNVEGYSAGFGLTGVDFTGAQSVVVQLYSGATLLQTDTAINPTTEFAGDTQISSPFDVFGTFNYVTDNYWTNVRGAEYGQTLTPTSVVATVTLANGKVVTATNTNLAGTPVVISVSPTSGTTAGGTPVTITGLGLGGATIVDFGATPATGFTQVTSTTITATAPAGTGTADVTVTTPAGTSAINSPADQFTYGAPSPVTVTIIKYIDGKAASTTLATADFPMVSTTTASNLNEGTQLVGNYDLNAGDSYQAVTSSLASGASYATNEILGGSVVGSSCANSYPFSLAGYSTGATLAAAQTAEQSLTPPSFANLTTNEYVIVWNHDCSTGNGSLNGNVVDNGVLHVDSITANQTNATADNVWADGLSYTFHITAPSSEPNLSMKFSDWLNGANILPVANNMRIFSPESSNATNEGSAIILTDNNYSSPLDMIWDTATSTPAGRQVDVTVEVKVPVGTADGAYTTTYGVQTLP